jgi:hypothetical protein
MGDEADRIVEDGELHELLHGEEREVPKQAELRALTLWRPWPHAILYGGKRIENRPWKPWKSVMGHYIALHAGRKYDKDGAIWMHAGSLYEPPEDQWCPAGCIMGVARVTGYVDKHGFDQDGELAEHVLKSPWWSGPFAWILDDVVPFLAPVKAKGKQGLWPVDDATKALVREAHRQALKV